MSGLLEKRIVLGVSGGIAAYKTPEIVRRLRERGARVRVVMTAAAREFIGPLSLQAVSGEPVHLDLLDPTAEAAMGHIELARWADTVLIAPASADLLARLAHGLCDDLLSTLALATEAPILVAPAMNRVMWSAAATQANLRQLHERGLTVLGPGEGAQACGEHGPGRMLEPGALVEALASRMAPPVLAGRKVLVTAGPTREPVDPVRYVGNRSSGRMGYALARAARAAGAEVTLVSGPVSLPAPAGVRRVSVESAAQMLAAVQRELPGQDVFIAAAAVADYRPSRPEAQKIKKAESVLTLTLERTADILEWTASRAERPFLVGFAAETEDVEAHARHKLARKRLDMIAANDVGVPGIGFESEHNALQVYWPGGSQSLPYTTKEQLAHQLVALIAERHGASGPG